MRLGRVGVWQGGYGAPAADERALIAEVEALGYGAFWFGEADAGREAFTRAAALLAASSTIVVGTGIASIWGRDPSHMAMTIRTVGEAFPGRFVAGVGISHPPAAAARGCTYERPLARMHDYLAAMHSVRHCSPAPREPVPLVLGALRPKMLALAGAQADGAHPYFVTVEHTRRARAILGSGKLLAPELAVVLEPDAGEARRVARLHTSSFYLQAPNYVENLRWLGWSDDDLANGGSDALVDAVVAWGDEEAISTRVAEHLAAGADHVCIQPVFEPDGSSGGHESDTLDVLRRLAPAVREL